MWPQEPTSRVLPKRKRKKASNDLIWPNKEKKRKKKEENPTNPQIPLTFLLSHLFPHISSLKTLTLSHRRHSQPPTTKPSTPLSSSSFSLHHHTITTAPLSTMSSVIDFFLFRHQPTFEELHSSTPPLMTVSLSPQTLIVIKLHPSLLFLLLNQPLPFMTPLLYNDVDFTTTTTTL